jgi:hypothetical protein
MVNFIDILHFYSCEWLVVVYVGPSTLFFPGAYNAVKMTLGVSDVSL